MNTSKPQRKNHTAMQKLILAAAADIVETQGFDKLSIRSLAQALNLSVGTIYNYFADINDLILHINSETIVQLDQAMRISTLQKAENVPRLLVDTYFDFLEANPKRWRSVFMHYPPQDFVLPQWYIKVIEDAVQHVCEILAPHFKDYPKSRGRDVIVGLWATLHGLSMLEQQGKLKTVSALRGVRDIAHETIQHALKKDRS